MREEHMTRRGLTLEYLLEKRSRLIEELRSDAHYEHTETIFYGSHDPFEVPVALCDNCGNGTQMRKVEGPQSIRWTMVCCSCGKEIPTPQRRPWQAALAWNEINLASLDYRELPLFGLRKLDPTDAKKRMIGIRRNLELRKKLAGLERAIAQRTGKRPPGKLYQQRLEAYLKWSMLAIRLAKLAESRLASSHLEGNEVASC